MSKDSIDVDIAVCPTCEHPMAHHDVIGRRWCAVSANADGHRDCICSGVVVAARDLTHY